MWRDCSHLSNNNTFGIILLHSSKQAKIVKSIDRITLLVSGLTPLISHKDHNNSSIK